MKRALPFLRSALLSCAMLAPLVSVADDKPMTKKEVEAIVKQVILDNPDFILKTLIEYQEKQQLERVSKATLNLSKLRDKVQNDPRSPSIGNPKGDVVVVEFFDYHCGYCKRFMPEIAQLLKEDTNVRVVFKEFPILREDSVTAAKAALAVYHINKSKYLDYHILLMKTNDDFTEEVLTSKAKEIGIDPDTFKKAMADPQLEKDIEDIHALADSVNITGTPGIIIGSEVMPGAISYDKLKATVQEVRDGQNQQKGVDKSDGKSDE